MISKQKIEELRNIIATNYGRDISHEQAAEIANTLVRYFDLLAKIKHREVKETYGK